MKSEAVLPTLRERKRYLAFEVISERPVADTHQVADAIMRAAHQYLGEHGLARAGLMVLREKYNPKAQRGILKVGHTQLDGLRASLCLIQMIDRTKATVRSIGASGTLKKAYNRYIAG